MSTALETTLPLPLLSLTERGGSELSDYRRAALDAAARIGLPSTRDDRWKYTALSKISSLELAIPSGEVAIDETVVADRRVADACNLVIVNGVWDRERSDSQIPENVVVEPLEEGALSREFRRGPEWHPFAAWNSATFLEGLHIRVAGKATNPCLNLIFVSTGAADSTTSWSAPRVRIEIDANASATVLETYVTSGDGAALSAPVTEGFVGENASLEHIRIQDEGPQSRHFGVARFRQQRSSRIAQYQFTLGAAISRYDAEVILDGEGADLLMNGAYLLEDSQSGDHQTIIDHAVPHCTSREMYRGILDGDSRGIFEGRIIVRPDAQKTSAEQSNDNLILSETAIANSTPQLEIFADDVKCRHGSTIGRLDEGSIFYLRSRGIGEKDARSILTMGFAGEVLTEIQHQPTREWLEQKFINLLEGRSA